LTPSLVKNSCLYFKNISFAFKKTGREKLFVQLSTVSGRPKLTSGQWSWSAVQRLWEAQGCTLATVALVWWASPAQRASTAVCGQTRLRLASVSQNMSWCNSFERNSAQTFKTSFNMLTSFPSPNV